MKKLIPAKIFLFVSILLYLILIPTGWGQKLFSQSIFRLVEHESPFEISGQFYGAHYCSDVTNTFTNDTMKIECFTVLASKEEVVKADKKYPKFAYDHPHDKYDGFYYYVATANDGWCGDMPDRFTPVKIKSSTGFIDGVVITDLVNGKEYRNPKTCAKPQQYCARIREALTGRLLQEWCNGPVGMAYTYKEVRIQMEVLNDYFEWTKLPIVVDTWPASDTPPVE